ncbi:FxSxx-COOH system tetratricopeptide repeat protein [Streptomyces sp. NBC_00448]|uniref:FxSxx-COOH system tetratricopeptide repeat protein n=1 Tax=Streptomyces sp. NBC_00448 TaxID=2903652 RepID=UPI002E238E62
MNVVPPPEAPVEWPLRLGSVPALASAFQDRTDVRERIDAATAGHATTVVLTQVLAGGGGVGKTQLAAAYAHQALAAGTEFVAWIDAAGTEQVTDSYARAARLVRAPGASGADAEADARAFTAWLATTPRSWLVVLDDVTDLDALDPWWPPASAAGCGRALATTRRREARLSGGGRTVVDIDSYTPAEADAYLSARLTGAGAAHLLDDHVAPLARELGLLPLALAHAAGYMVNQDVPCAHYLRLFTDRTTRLPDVLPPDADTEGYGRQVAATLLLSLEAAEHRDPPGLALPALRLAAVLDPAGHPRDLWATDPVTDYLTAHRSIPTAPGSTPSGPVDAVQARAAVRLLHRYGLISDDSRAGLRAVRLHALTARAAREATPADQFAPTVEAAADALLAAWPEADHTAPELSAVLRANTDALASHAADLLWQPDTHPVLHRAGHSFLAMGPYATAITHWHDLAAAGKRLLGAEHPETLTSRANLAAAYWQAGRTAEAIGIEEEVLADRERLLGSEHPDTLTSRANLAASYGYAGRTGEAIGIEERVLADRERLLGSEHPDTLSSMANLAVSYRDVGRTAEAIGVGERVLADRERLLGPGHPDTLSSRANLAVAYRDVGRTAESIGIGERVLADRERLLGPGHPDTLSSRANLAVAYWYAGRTAESIGIGERVLADRERLLGAGHPDTLSSRVNLAASYRWAGRTDEAVVLLERVVADRARLFGAGHPDTVEAAGRLEEWKGLR